MVKAKFSKKILAVLVALTLCVAVSLPAFAAEPATATTTSNSVVTPDAISGSGSASGSSGSFQIYSPGWGIWGHAVVTVTGNPIYISIDDYAGADISYGGSTVGALYLGVGSNQRVNLTRASSGYYTVTYYTVNGGNANVYVTLADY